MGLIKKNKNIYGLVCSGGGAIGAYQVGALKYIHEFFCLGNRSPFQIFAGVSCGSLNTTFFAHEAFQAYESRLLLEKLWKKFHVPAYHQDFFKCLQGSLFRLFRGRMGGQNPLWSILDPTPMFNIINEGLNRKNLERSFETGSTLGVAVAATEIINCSPCWFVEGPRAVEWKRFHSLGIKDRIGTAHVAASCSVPFFMPPVRVGRHYFLDGAIKLERPFSAAISMGATRILSISTQLSPSHELTPYHENFRPTPSTLIRFMLKAFSQDLSFSESEQIRVLNRFSEKLRRSWNPIKRSVNLMNALFDENFLPAGYHPIDVYLMHPSRSAEELFREFHSEITSSKKGRSAKTFMFHRDFIIKLIQLGYEDAKHQHSKLKQFFSEQKAAT